MVVHRRKKSRKKSFRRSGEIRRGAGNRGGRGRAGFGKRAAHKKLLAIKLGMLPGKRGFSSIKQRFNKKERIITIDQLNEILWELKRNNKELKINLSELGFDKLVGRGFPKFPATILVKSYTENAKRKIELIGGRIVEIH